MNFIYITIEKVGYKWNYSVIDKNQQTQVVKKMLLYILLKN